MHFVDSILVRISTGRSGGTWGPYSSTFDTSPKWVASKNNGPATGDSDYFNWWLPYSCGIWIVVWWKLKYLFLTSTTRGGVFLTSSWPFSNLHRSKHLNVLSRFVSSAATVSTETWGPNSRRRPSPPFKPQQWTEESTIDKERNKKKRNTYICVYIYMCVSVECAEVRQNCVKAILWTTQYSNFIHGTKNIQKTLPPLG